MLSDKKVPPQDSKERKRMAAVAIDYETYYHSKDGYSLSSMSPQLYCADDRFDAYLVAICGWEITDDGIFEIDGVLEGWEPGKTITRWSSDGRSFVRKLPDGRQLYVGRPENFRDWANLKNRVLIAHNAAFDSVVTDELAKRGLVPHWLLESEWKCTADLCAYLMVPRNLKGAMKELFGKEISKAVRSAMDGRHDYELTPDERRDLVEYGGSDAVECHDIWLKHSAEWPEIEQAISDQKREATKRGILVDADYANESLKELKRYHADVVCDIPWHPEKAVGSLPALRQAVLALGIEAPKSFKKDDPGFLDWQKEHNDIPFIAARQKAVAINMHAARLEGILSSIDKNGLSHPAFLYFGAHTGRDSGKSSTGGSNTNMLNMPRKPILQGDEHVFGGKGVDVRGMYIARPGHKFVIADYAQVEARFLLWLVDDTHMMEAMEREGNLYQAAAVVMGWSKPGENIKKNDPDKYRLAKCCLTGDTLVLVRSKKLFGKGLTRPHYKRIMRVVSTDQVWDGHEWVTHLGAERMKYVKKEELIETGGICLTRDHKIYINDTESRRADEVLGDEETSAVAWGQTQNPVQGWAHVWILAAALFGACARALYLGARESLHLLASALHLHRVRSGDATPVGQRAQGSDDSVHEVRSQNLATEGCTERVGEGA